MLGKELYKEACEMQDRLVSWRRQLHTHPEVGFKLECTKKFVYEQLEEMGYRPRYCGRCGVIALIGKDVGKTFLLRADMDALPIREESELNFASINGNMHACGHDLHTVMLLGAAYLLKRHEKELNGSVKLMFQPAEESLEGAKDMINAGALDNPPVQGAMMLHVMSGIPFETGQVIIPTAGVGAPAADMFEVTIHGKGCHGAMPNTGVDPLNAAAHILLATQEIKARELSIGERAVLTFGNIQARTAANVIPDVVKMQGSLRAFDEDGRNFIKKRLVEIAEGIAKTFRASAEVTFLSGCPTLINDESLLKSAGRYASELLGNRRVLFAKEFLQGDRASDTSGSEDFAYVSQKVPSVMLAIAAGNKKNGYEYPLHHPKVIFDEKVLSTGSALHAWVAMQWLKEQEC